MKLALLGADAVTRAVADSIAARGRHELVAVCELDEGPAAQQPGWPAHQAARIDNWEALLDPQWIDGVVVAYSPDEERRADQLRKFVEAGTPILAAHPLFASMLVYYELDMIRRDTGCVMVPYLPDRLHPAIVELSRLAATDSDRPIGEIEQVILERHLPDRSKPVVLASFARDVDLIRAVAGELSRIGAMGAGAARTTTDSAAYASLGVQMSGPAGLLARWSVVPAAGAEYGRLMLLGSAGRAEVYMPASGEPWKFDLTAGGSQLSRQIDAVWHPADVALDCFERAVAGVETRPGWPDAARSLELTETIHRSLAKGRTIELLQEDYTEKGTFKGTMASLGCGVLMVGLVLLVVVAVIEDLAKAAGKRIPLAGTWPYLLLGLLGFFLLMQLLLLAFRREPPRADGPGPDSPADRSG